MTPTQYVAIRKKFFPNDPTRFLIEMGYAGNPDTLRTRARRFENGKLPIPRNVARFVWLLDQWRLQGAQEDGEMYSLPAWPEGL